MCGIIGLLMSVIMVVLSKAVWVQSFGFKDALFPFRLYGLILKHLPSTRLTIYFGAWGVAAIVSAAVLTGGLGHWFTYLPHNQKNQMKNLKK